MANGKNKEKAILKKTGSILHRSVAAVYENNSTFVSGKDELTEPIASSLLSCSNSSVHQRARLLHALLLQRNVLIAERVQR